MFYLADFNVKLEIDPKTGLKIPVDRSKIPPSNNLKKLGVIGGIGTAGYLGYKGYKKWRENNPKTEIPIGDETDKKVLSKVGKGVKWSIGATASGKALDYGRRFVGYNYANHKLKNSSKLNSGQKEAYEKMIKSGGALGSIKNDYHYLTGVGDIGNKAKKFWGTKLGKISTVGGIGALGAGLYGYKKAKEYYLI